MDTALEIYGDTVLCKGGYLAGVLVGYLTDSTVITGGDTRQTGSTLDTLDR